MEAEKPPDRPSTSCRSRRATPGGGWGRPGQVSAQSQEKTLSQLRDRQIERWGTPVTQPSSWSGLAGWDEPPSTEGASASLCLESNVHLTGNEVSPGIWGPEAQSSSRNVNHHTTKYAAPRGLHAMRSHLRGAWESGGLPCSHPPHTPACQTPARPAPPAPRLAPEARGHRGGQGAPSLAGSAETRCHSREGQRGQIQPQAPQSPRWQDPPPLLHPCVSPLHQHVPQCGPATPGDPGPYVVPPRRPGPSFLRLFIYC